MTQETVKKSAIEEVLKHRPTPQYEMMDKSNVRLKEFPFTILEALSATGLRSIRYAKELGNVSRITANDMDVSAVEAIKSNVKFNGVEEVVEPSLGNAV